ncbi:MAG: response regulator transcription factor [Mesorhizobium sp.]|nr:MAG: response regulator transcription factor [Mesorhizobium sp.]
MSDNVCSQAFFQRRRASGENSKRARIMNCAILPSEATTAPLKPLVAICSQDVEFYLMLSHILEVDGFSSTLASTDDETLELAEATTVQAWILDCRAANQMAVTCGRLRQDPRTESLPVIALIAPDAQNQHIGLLKAGIDECFVRPTAPAKLLIYLRSRLGNPVRSEAGLSLSYGGIEMQIDTHHVRCKGEEILLGPIEFKLLRYMLENPEKVISREELIKIAWPRNVFVGPRTVDVHISRLRRCFRQFLHADVIRTVRLGGYALEDQSLARS